MLGVNGSESGSQIVQFPSGGGGGGGAGSGEEGGEEDDEEGGGGKGGKRKRPNAKRGLSWLILLPTKRKPGQQHHDNAVPARQFEEFEALLSAVQRLDPGSTNKDWEAVAEDVAKVTGEPERSPSILFNKFKEAGTMFGGPSGMSGANHPRTVSIMSKARALCKLYTPLCKA